ncbi:MAG: 1-acyl-sn-glycerol-3-phosphate acyltransferase [Polyangiaceae bacterium]
MTRTAMKALFTRIIGVYFRDIEVVGDAPPESVHGRIFAANHVNGLVDPILVLTSARPVIAPVAKSTLWKVPGLRWLLDTVDAVPILRRRDDPNKSAAANDEVFSKVSGYLRKGGNILIFPEGTSHNEPKLVPLKSGIGRMLARAKADGGDGLSFQAVGLEFDARDVFRSRALVVYGPVRDVDPLAEGGAVTGDALAAAIMDVVRADLGSLVVEADTWEDRVLAARVTEVLTNETGDRSLAARNDVGRRVQAARTSLRKNDTAFYEALVAAVREYSLLLDEARVTDADVLARRTHRHGRLLRAMVLLVAAPFALVGAIVYWLPYQVPRLVARKAEDDHDVVSTYKLGTGLVLFPTWAIAVISGAWFAVPHATWAAIAMVVLVSPFAALLWMDRLERTLHRVRVAFTSEAARSERIRLARARVVSLVAEARAKAASDTHE